MKRLSRSPLLLFSLPFLVLAVVSLRPSTSLTLATGGQRFAEQIAGEISTGMSVPQAEEFLDSQGFAKGAIPSDIVQGKSIALSPKKLGFIKTQRTFPRFWEQHMWRVGIIVRDNRIQEIQTSVE